jgi:plasmid stabilization system protein ParE
VTLPIAWRREAAAEYHEAIRWYADVDPQLARRFAQAVEYTVVTVSESPLRFPFVHKNRRRALVGRFPYGIFFLLEPTRIVVIACFHGKRNPRRWQRR